MVKLLGIAGSPRKGGNTEIMIREALKAGELEGAETELIHLVDYNLEPCDGCETCFKTKKCVIEDDVEKVYEKMVEADGIIVGSPVYYYNITAQTKTFMDRIGHLHSARGRTAFRNKIGGGIAVATRSGQTAALSQILLFLSFARIIIAGHGAVTGLSSAKGEANKDATGITFSRELGKSMVQIAKATTSLRRT